MKKINNIAVMLSALFAAALIFASCNNGTIGGIGGGGKIDPALVGKWYMNDEPISQDNPESDLMYEFRSDGRIGIASQGAGAYYYSASGGKLTITYSYNGTTLPLGPAADYSIVGTKLTLSNTLSSGLLAGTYYKR